MIHDVVAAPFPTGGVTSTSSVRLHNERTVFGALCERQPGAASDLIRTTGLSKPTVTTALGVLEQAGLIEQAGHRTGGAGRAPRTYQLCGSAAAAIAIDIGRVWIRAAAVDLAGMVRERREVRTRSTSARALMRQLTEIARDFGGKLGPTPVTHCVLGSPGVFDHDADVIRLSPNLPGWDAPDVLHGLRAALPGRLSVENDVNLAALAEQAAFHEAGDEKRDFVFISVGSGLGMGVIADGRLRRGWQGAAGELSYLPRGGSGPAGRLLETQIGPQAVLAAARAAGLRVEEPAAVFDAARAGDAVGQRVIRAEARRLARVIATVTVILDPPLVVLGGALARNGDLLLAPIRSELQRLVPLHAPGTQVSSLGSDATLRGAIAQALRQMRASTFDTLM